MKDRYIYEKPGPVGTLIQVVGFACLFGGMFLGHVWFEEPIGGFLTGLAVFLTLIVSFTRLSRNIDHMHSYRLPKESEGV